MNKRLTEHYHRVLYSEKQFEYQGFRTAGNNPDVLHEFRFPKSFSLNEEYNDKGLITIRYGPPDKVEFINDWQTNEANESWIYWQTDENPQMVFHFTMKGSLGNNWRLTPLPSDKRLYEKLTTIDSKYFRMIRGSAADRYRAEEEARSEIKGNVSLVLSTERSTLDNDLGRFEIPHSIDVFRHERGQALVNVSYAIPYSVFGPTVKDTVAVVNAEVSVAARKANRQPVYAKLDTVIFTMRSSIASFVGLIRCTLPPGNYDFSMQIRPIGFSFMGACNENKGIPKYGKTELELSDLELLLEAPLFSTFEIYGIKVSPSPYETLPLTKPLMVYYHIYNLVTDDDGNTSFRIQYSLKRKPSSVLSKIFSLGKETGIVKQVDRTGREDFSAEFYSFDVSDLEPGDYEVSLLVTDRKAARTIQKSRTVSLYVPEPSPSKTRR